MDGWRRARFMPIERIREGRVAEWFKAAVLKPAVGASPPWVRIPPLPPKPRIFKEDGYACALRIERIGRERKQFARARKTAQSVPATFSGRAAILSG